MEEKVWKIICYSINFNIRSILVKLTLNFLKERFKNWNNKSNSDLMVKFKPFFRIDMCNYFVVKYFNYPDLFNTENERCLITSVIILHFFSFKKMIKNIHNVEITPSIDYPIQESAKWTVWIRDRNAIQWPRACSLGCIPLPGRQTHSSSLALPNP